MKDEKIFPVKGMNDLKEIAETNSRVNVIDDDVCIIKNLDEFVTSKIVKLDVVAFLFCKRGALTVTLNNMSHEVGENDLLICMPNFLIGNVVMTSDFECDILCLSSKMVQEIFFYENDVWNKLFYVNRHPIIHISDEEEYMTNEFYALLAYKIEHKKKARHRKIIKLIVHAMLYELLTYVEENFIAPVDSDRIKQGDILFKRFMELLAGCEVKNRTVTYYADKLYVSPKYLSAVCKSMSGKTASKLIKESVMVDVKHLLLYTDKSVKEIAAVLDFPSLSFFGKFVRHNFGCSPNEFRRRQRNQKG